MVVELSSMNIASTGKSPSFEGGLCTLFKTKFHLNVTAECLHDVEETLLLAIILREGFQIIHIEEMIRGLPYWDIYPSVLSLSIKLR